MHTQTNTHNYTWIIAYKHKQINTAYNDNTSVHFDPLIRGHVSADVWRVQVSVQHHDRIGEDKTSIFWAYNAIGIINKVLASKYLYTHIT